MDHCQPRAGASQEGRPRRGNKPMAPPARSVRLRTMFLCPWYGRLPTRQLADLFSNRGGGRCYLGKGIMSVLQRIDKPSFGPEALKAIGEAFDAAWTEIAEEIGADPVAIETARLRLANAVLSDASENSRDVEALKRGALQAMGRTSP